MAWTGTELYEQVACAEGDLGDVVVMMSEIVGFV